MILLFYTLSCHLGSLQDPLGVEYDVIVLNIFIPTHALM